MRITIPRAGPAILATAGLLVLGAQAAQAAPAHTHPATVVRGAAPDVPEPWCAVTNADLPYCMYDEGATFPYNLFEASPGPYSTFTTEYSTTWAGYAAYVYEDDDGLCMGWNGLHGESALVVANTCHNGLDQQFVMDDGFLQNAGESSGTGDRFVVDADLDDVYVALIVEDNSGSPNVNEEWIR
jgi:hypothetical protein